MAKVSTNLGKVATTPKGEYSNETTYIRLDIVSYNGSSYVCLKESVGNLPTNTEYWQLIASKGDTGAKGQDGKDGQDGYTPIKGVDYFTQEDIASLNIPSKTSDITNDSGFITNSVNNLVNYYLKNEIYTKDEVTALIGAIQQFHYEVVQELPQTGANNIMYLVPKSTSQTNNVYDEYVYSNGWEKIGDTEIDLSNYVTITMLNQALANYTTTANLTTLLNTKQNEITSSNKLNADLVDDTNSTNKFFSGDYEDLTNKPIFPNLQYISQSSSEPFVFSGKKAGIYCFNDYNSFYYKITDDSDVKYLSSMYVPIIIMTEDYEYVSGKKIPCEIFSVKIESGTTDGQQNEIYINPSITNSMALSTNRKIAGIYLSTTNQTIKGAKTFINIPKQNNTTAPTEDREFTNKKYVDDQISGAIGSINTILATLTTPSSNGGGE